MKNLAKLSVISVVGLAGLFVFLGSVDLSRVGSVVLAKVAVTPTPKPANTAVTAANTAANTSTTTTNAAKPAAPSSGDRSIPKSFTLAKDSASEYGEAAFDHDSHAFKNYSPDGKSVMGCVECHHTDQPKSALKPPLVTSERDVTMTFDTWKASSQKVSDCRACHFQAGNVPDGKEMPTTTEEWNNKAAYHKNCNVCHDAAFKARPELKGKPGFATSSDCTICHKPN